ncbi:PP2C family protein-serine/threonine phosphatase [Streptomyces sp. NPDC002187]|uniref:PP2C family protein-serine/threonine phosphatase n=1 Tax=Streptomyces sp. NPDC002187 TaxID=3364637 RepID=UPI0036976E40
MDIGGDFYDLIRLSENEVAAVIGDVQGHNVTAAGFMGQVRTAIHAYAVAGAPPGEVLRRTNLLIADLDPDLLTSCLYAHIDLTGHSAQLATAGHRQPLLRNPDLHTRVLDVPPGPLLGADPRASSAWATARQTSSESVSRGGRPSHRVPPISSSIFTYRSVSRASSSSSQNDLGRPGCGHRGQPPSASASHPRLCR